MVLRGVVRLTSRRSHSQVVVWEVKSGGKGDRTTVNPESVASSHSPGVLLLIAAASAATAVAAATAAAAATAVAAAAAATGSA